jgi:hypothetical protein
VDVLGVSVSCLCSCALGRVGIMILKSGFSSPGIYSVIYSAVHQDISRNYLKKLCIVVIANVSNSLKQCNGCDNTKWSSEQ